MQELGPKPSLVLTSELNELNQTYNDKLAVLDCVLTLRPRSGPSFACSADGPGIGVVMPSALGGYRFEPNKVMFGNGTERIGPSDLLQPRDMLISRGNKRDQVGLCIVYPGGSEPRTYANLLMKMQVKEGVSPDFVKYWLMSPLAVRYIRKTYRKEQAHLSKRSTSERVINLPFPKNLSDDEQLEWAAPSTLLLILLKKSNSLLATNTSTSGSFPTPC